MNRPCCGERAGDEVTDAGRAARTCGEASAWVVSSAVLILMPKCPACVAAYIAAGTGLGVSVSGAGYARVALLTIGAASIGFLAVRRIRRGMRHRRASAHQV